MKNRKLIKAILIAMLAISTLQGADTNTTRTDDNKTTETKKDKVQKVKIVNGDITNKRSWWITIGIIVLLPILL